MKGYDTYQDHVMRAEQLAARRKVLVADAERLQAGLKKMTGPGTDPLVRLRQSRMTKVEAQIAAIEREGDLIESAISELRQKFPELPAPFEDEGVQLTLLRERLRGKRLQLAGLRGLMARSAGEVLGAGARAQQAHELEDEVRYYEAFVRRLEEPDHAVKSS